MGHQGDEGAGDKGQGLGGWVGVGAGSCLGDTWLRAREMGLAPRREFSGWSGHGVTHMGALHSERKRVLRERGQGWGAGSSDLQGAQWWGGCLLGRLGAAGGAADTLRSCCYGGLWFLDPCPGLFAGRDLPS